MKRIFLLISLISLSSCFIINDAMSQNARKRCVNNCYEQYQINIQPCVNSLYNVECKEPFEAIYKECLEGCNKSGSNNSRAESDEQKALREQRNKQYEEHYK